MAFPSEANILRRALSASASLIASLKNRQWGLFRDPTGDYVAGGLNRNSGAMFAKDDLGRIHEFPELRSVEGMIEAEIETALGNLSVIFQTATLQQEWTSSGVEYAYYDPSSYEFSGWTATPSGPLAFSGTIKYAIDSFGNLLLSGSPIPPASIASLAFSGTSEGLQIFRIANNLLDTSLDPSAKRGVQFITQSPSGGSEPLWQWKLYANALSANSLSFRFKDDSGGGSYSRPSPGSTLLFTRGTIPLCAPQATPTTGSGSSPIPPVFIFVNDTSGAQLRAALALPYLQKMIFVAAGGLALDTAETGFEIYGYNHISGNSCGLGTLPGVDLTLFKAPGASNAVIYARSNIFSLIVGDGSSLARFDAVQLFVETFATPSSFDWTTLPGGLFKVESYLPGSTQFANGLEEAPIWHSRASIGNFRFIHSLDDLRDFLAEDMDSGVGLLADEISFDHGLNSFDFRGRKQLHFGALAGHSDTDLLFTRLSGYGSLYIYSPFAFAGVGPIAVDSSGMIEIFLKRASKIGTLPEFSASGWGTGAYYETIQLPGIIMSGQWEQAFWDDTSGDNKVAADSSDDLPGLLVDKLCDGNGAAFPVEVVGGIRKVKIDTAGFPDGFYLVSTQAELQAVADLAAPMRKSVIGLPPWPDQKITLSALTIGRNLDLLNDAFDFSSATISSQFGSGTIYCRGIPQVTGGLTLGDNTSVLFGGVDFAGTLTKGSGANCYAENNVNGSTIAGLTLQRLDNSLYPSSPGLVAVGTAAGSSPRSIAVAPASGLSITNPAGTAGDPTIGLNLAGETTPGSVPARGTTADRVLAFTGGVLSWVEVTANMIASNAITNVKVSASAAIAWTKMAALSKGGLVTASGTSASNIATLGVGTDGQVLTADSAQTLGIKWATPGGGGSSAKAFTLTFGRYLNGWLSNSIQFPPGGGWNGSYDDGVLAPNIGSKVPVASTIKAVSFDANTYAAGNATLSINKNGSLTTIGTITGAAMNFTGLSISIAAGDRIWFETSAPTSGGSCKGMTIVAYFEA
jgi:hypothetical protein